MEAEVEAEAETEPSLFFTYSLGPFIDDSFIDDCLNSDLKEASVANEQIGEICSFRSVSCLFHNKKR